MKIYKIYDSTIINLSIPKNSTQLLFRDYVEIYIKNQLIKAGFDLRNIVCKTYDIENNCIIYTQED